MKQNENETIEANINKLVGSDKKLIVEQAFKQVKTKFPKTFFLMAEVMPLTR